jgi:hypothetical protein
MEFFLGRVLTVPDAKRSRFQKRFQFQRRKIRRNFGCPWMPTDTRIRSPRLGRADLQYELVRVGPFSRRSMQHRTTVAGTRSGGYISLVAALHHRVESRHRGAKSLRGRPSRCSDMETDIRRFKSSATCTHQRRFYSNTASWISMSIEGDSAINWPPTLIFNFHM